MSKTKKTKAARPRRDIIFVLDRSGSMETVKSDTIGGFNAFIDEQKKVKADVRITLVQFDDQYEIVYTARPIKSVEPMTAKTFVPRGWTALHDAIGKTIVEAKTGKNKVVFVVLTDGHENASKEYTGPIVQSLVERHKAWEFVYLGANQDAVLTAKNLGIKAVNTMTFDPSSIGTQTVLRATSLNVANYMSGVADGVAYSLEQRAEQEALLKGQK